MMPDGHIPRAHALAGGRDGLDAHAACVRGHVGAARGAASADRHFADAVGESVSRRDSIGSRHEGQYVERDGGEGEGHAAGLVRGGRHRP